MQDPTYNNLLSGGRAGVILHLRPSPVSPSAHAFHGQKTLFYEEDCERCVHLSRCQSGPSAWCVLESCYSVGIGMVQAAASSAGCAPTDL